MNSMSWVVIVGEGAIGVCVWFGAPIIGSEFGWILACWLWAHAFKEPF